jgi:hypothetical protein
MSWSLFKTKCAVLTGPQHISETQFAQTIADAYHSAVSLHFDSMTAGGKLINNAPKLPILQQQIQMWCSMNRTTSQDVDFLKQIGPAFIQYWTLLSIIGPTGSVIVTSPGVWNNIRVTQNFDFQIILNALILSCRVHLTTLTGIYTSSVIPGVTAPWNGTMFQSLP